MSARLVLVLAMLSSLGTSGCWLFHDRDPRGTPPPVDAGVDAPWHSTPRYDAAVPLDTGFACAPGEGWFEPGCVEGGDVTIAADCYRPCSGPGDTTCEPGMFCRPTSIDPCMCRPGGACCSACAAEAWLCLPPDPPPIECETREYCGCRSGCEPLIDTTSGCVCPCDEPFFCGGPTCDCDCGGARYLGCARAGVCPETEVSCEEDCIGVLIDGCPTCVCAG